MFSVGRLLCVSLSNVQQLNSNLVWSWCLFEYIIYTYERRLHTKLPPLSCDVRELIRSLADILNCSLAALLQTGILIGLINMGLYSRDCICRNYSHLPPVGIYIETFYLFYCCHLRSIVSKKFKPGPNYYHYQLTIKKIRSTLITWLFFIIIDHYVLLRMRITNSRYTNYWKRINDWLDSYRFLWQSSLRP